MLRTLTFGAAVAAAIAAPTLAQGVKSPATSGYIAYRGNGDYRARGRGLGWQAGV